MSEGMPKRWTSCEIGEVAQVVGGSTPPSKDPTNFEGDDGVPWITPADLSGYKETYIGRGVRNLSAKGFAACSVAMLPAGTVLFSSRAPVGYVAIAANPVCTNQGFKSFVLPEGLDSRFVYYYLRHIKPIAEERATGTTFKELSGATASRLPLKISPANEQKRIADKLDAVLARVDACRERLDRVPDILKRFRQAVLAAATSGKLTEDWRPGFGVIGSAQELVQKIAAERKRLGLLSASRKISDEGIEIPASELPQSWTWCRVGQIADVRLGGTPSRKEPGYWQGIIPWVSSGEVRNCRISDTYESLPRDWRTATQRSTRKERS